MPKYFTEDKHGKQWFWSGGQIRFIKSPGGAWHPMAFLARRFDARRLPA